MKQTGKRAQQFRCGAAIEKLEERRLLSDATAAVVFKVERFDQTSSAAPVADSNDPFGFEAFLLESAGGAVSGASVAEAAPTVGSPLALSESSTSPAIFEGNTNFNDQPSLDAADPQGTYNLAVTGASDGAHTFALDLGPSDAFISAPVDVTDFAALQAIDTQQATTISWNAVAGASAGDFIVVFVTNPQHQPIFYTFPNASNAISGTATQAVIPAGTLAPGSSYSAAIEYFKVMNTDTSDYPGVTGYAAFNTTTELTVVTAGVAVPAKLAFTQQPGPVSGGTSPGEIDVSVEDAQGNVVNGDSSTVTLALSSSGGAVLSGTLAVAAVNGLAEFNTLAISQVGVYTLTASDGALAGAVSDSFTITTEFVGGVFNVLGTGGDDVITLQISNNGSVSANIDGQTGQSVTASQIVSIVVDAGAGNDLVTIESGVPAASVQGGTGDDTIIGGVGDDTLGGGQGNDYVLGGQGNDLIHGGAGDDTIGGGQGNDILYGGLGNDTITGGLGNDTLVAGAGVNLLRGGAGDDTLFAINSAADTLYGGLGANTAHVDQNLDQIPNGDIQTILTS